MEIGTTIPDLLDSGVWMKGRVKRKRDEGREKEKLIQQMGCPGSGAHVYLTFMES